MTALRIVGCLICWSAIFLLGRTVAAATATAAEISALRPQSDLKEAIQDLAKTAIWSGDLRLREQSEELGTGDTRNSQKLRARLGVKFEVKQNLMTEFRLATSRSGNSSNQSLGDSKEPGQARRYFGLDLAYGRLEPLKEVSLYAGRIPQIHDRPGKSQILLDSDFALEGAAAKISVPLANEWSFQTNWGSTWLRENYDSYYSVEETDSMLNWGQLSISWTRGDAKANLGTGFFNFSAIQGRKFSELSVGGSARGNTDKGDGSFKDTYIPRQYFLDLSTKWEGFSYGLFAESIANTEANDPNRAWMAGIQFGKNQWSLSCSFQDLESDSVVGVFTDSDFAGGMTSSRGWILAGQWKFNQSAQVGITHYQNQRIEDAGVKIGQSVSYIRTHFDLSLMF